MTRSIQPSCRCQFRLDQPPIEKMNTPQIFLGSILLEPNRWTPARAPSVRISEWSERAAAAGFDGWELWENHYVCVDPQERAALRNGALPVRVFNSYAGFGAPDSAVAAGSFAVLAELPSVSAVKFNVGNNPDHIDRYRASIASVRATLHDGVRLWCECHPGTLLEDPSRLEDFVGHATTWPFDVIIHPFLLTPEAIIRWGKILGGRIKHAHLQMRDAKDPRRFISLAEEPGRVGEYLAALREIGFNGSYTLEFVQSVGTLHDIAATLFEDSVNDLLFLRSKFGAIHRWNGVRGIADSR
jgi:sugar phosphate isomerase/epimerase